MKSIQDLESSIDIVELVKRYSNLKKAGANYKSICPFPGHSEKTPSFVVSPSKQIGYCFGCHRGGGPLKFIMDVEGCSFKEAVDILSTLTGVKVKGYDYQTEKLKQNIYSLFREITNYYKKALQSNPPILKYLYDRGIKQEIMQIFEFGYADNGIELYHYLIQKGFSEELIEQSNVFLDIKTKKDKFIGRLIFPIKNMRGDIIAFAGRIISTGEPKYLNSPASNLYDKSSILYGLFDAKSEIIKKDFVIITEGYMDTITLHQAGYTNVVCVSGTALTEKHIQIIKKLTSKIYLCFDNDQAGENATKLSIEMLKNKDIEIKIIELQGGKDPDEIIKNGGDFSFLIQNALSPIGYELKKMPHSESITDKKQHLKKLLEIVKSYQDNVEKDSYLKEISNKLDIKLDIVYLEYNKTRLGRTQESHFVQTGNRLSSEDLIISYFVLYPEKFDFIKEHLIEGKKYFSYHLKSILEKGVGAIQEFDIDTKNKYIALSHNHEALEIQAQIENTRGKNDEKIEYNILKTISKFNTDMMKIIEKELKEKIKMGDMEALKEYELLIKIKK